MRKKMAAGFAVVIGATLALMFCGESRAELPVLPPMPDTTPAGKPYFDAKGAQVGEQIPDLTLKEPDGTARSLYGELNGPTLILTSSFTCPKSRSMFPKAAALIEKLKADKINLLVIYVLEAHPKGDVCPYSDVEDVTIENQRDQVLERQPRKMEDRLALAEKFRQRLNVKAPMLVDEMDNMAWKSLGGGPNMAVLVSGGGIVLARQGWFDDVSMEAAMKAYRAARPEPAVIEGPRKKSDVTVDFQEIIRAAEVGDVEALKANLAKSPEMAKVVFPDREGGKGDVRVGGTLLQFAAQFGRLAAVELLVEHGADVNRDTPRHAAPLYLAAKNESADVTRMLLAHGAKPDTRFRGTGPTALQQALLWSNADTAEALIKAGAGTNFFTDAATGNLEAVQKKLAEDPSVAMRPDGDGRPPLAYAAAGGQLKVAEALLAAGAHDFGVWGWGSHYDRSAIWFAVHNGNVPMIHLLCTNGSDPNLLDTAIVSTSAAAAVRELLACKADPNRADVIGYRPLHDAAVEDQPEIITMLLDAGAEPNAVTGPSQAPCGGGPDWYTPLHVARTARVIALLVKRGTKVNALDVNGETALHRVVGSFDEPAKLLGAAKELLASGVDVNVKSKWSGETALDVAESRVAYGKKPDRCVVDALLAHGAKHGKEIANPPATQPADE